MLVKGIILDKDMSHPQVICVARWCVCSAGSSMDLERVLRPAAHKQRRSSYPPAHHRCPSS